jgi:hypothetical protein
MAISPKTVVTTLEFTSFDVDNDTVSGKAEPDSEVNLWACVLMAATTGM